ncbi:MAG: metallophosphoesterase [Bacteroidales bacterium]|nr:metallophosphoesterase [Bacteroidales bacterium]MCF8391082.1 metallophosphoesterase [Bacteroidales bacterium]
MKIFYLFILLLFSLHLQGQVQPNSIIVDKTGSVHPWNNLDLNNNPDNFQFAIVTDRTGGHRDGVFEDAVKKLNLLQPEFVMSVGDMIEGYTREEEEIYRQWDEFNGFIGELQMPFFYVPGNHDYINDVMAKIWKEKYGRSYFHFVYKDVLFLCLNSEEATKGSNMGGIEKEQYNYIKKAIKENDKVKWTLVFMHQPLWILDNTRYWPEVENLLADRQHTVFVGHHHHFVKYQRNNGKYFILATTGGASRLRGPDFGEFDHVVWVTMTDQGPIIANLLLEGIWNEDVVNEEIATIISASPLRFEPLIVESDRFAKGTMEMKLVNDANSPMKYKIKIDNSKNLSSDKNFLEGIVPPNNVEILSSEIMNSALSLMNYESFRITAEFNYIYEGERNIKVNQNYNFAPTLMHNLKEEISKSEGESLKENSDKYSIGSDSWIIGDVFSYKGNDDASCEFNVSYDAEYLNIVAKVKDDEIVINPKKSVWQQDGLRIYIDSRPVRISASGKEQKNGYDYMGIFFSPAQTDTDEISVYQKDLFPEKTKITATYDESFLYYTISVPIEALKAMAGGNWKHIRLNIAVNDVDTNSSSVSLFWQPEWRSEENVIGSGIFKK